MKKGEVLFPTGISAQTLATISPELESAYLLRRHAWPTALVLKTAICVDLGASLNAWLMNITGKLLNPPGKKRNA